jgi:hypothetical protein
MVLLIMGGLAFVFLAYQNYRRNKWQELEALHHLETRRKRMLTKMNTAAVAVGAFPREPCWREANSRVILWQATLF